MSVSRFETQRSILGDLGSWPRPGGFVLDFGCGNGDLVEVYRENGYQAFGCDLGFKEGPNTEILRSKGVLNLIETDPYRLPYGDGSLDLVVSDQVFEHVRDYDTALAEIRRVLKKGGASLHVFPSRYRILEPHIHVPFATTIQNPWWLGLWAYAGVMVQAKSGPQPQAGSSVPAKAAFNHAFLRNNTNYLTREQIRERFARFFEDVRFCEDLFLKQSRKGHVVHSLSRVFRWLPDLYSTFGSRVVFARKG